MQGRRTAYTEKGLTCTERAVSLVNRGLSWRSVSPHRFTGALHKGAHLYGARRVAG